MEILETFPQVFCFRKSRINENRGNDDTVRGEIHFFAKDDFINLYGLNWL